jgi:hypothetical protein
MRSAAAVAQVIERPALMRGPLVLKTLADLKTHTRRLRGLERINKDPDYSWLVSCRDGVAVFGCRIPADDPCPIEVKCPYGKPGDRLWIKETWRPERRTRTESTPASDDVIVRYAADGSDRFFRDREIPGAWALPKAALKPGNVTPLFMPRWASRLTLEITELRVERLQAISEEDARAEGVEPASTGQRVYPGTGAALVQSYRAGFEKVWGEINGAESWAANPWVWVVSFRRVEVSR